MQAASVPAFSRHDMDELCATISRVFVCAAAA